MSFPKLSKNIIRFVNTVIYENPHSFVPQILSTLLSESNAQKDEIFLPERQTGGNVKEQNCHATE